MMNAFGSTPNASADEIAIGSIKMAVALLLSNCVLMLVSRITPASTITGSELVNSDKKASA